jgi:chromosome segregation ATPase
VELPELKLGLVGYRPKNVRLLLADRDAMFVRAAGEARALEEQVKELVDQLEEARNETARRAEELAASEQRERDTASGLERANGRLTLLERDLSEARTAAANDRDAAHERSRESAEAQGRIVQLEHELGAAITQPGGSSGDGGSMAPTSPEELSAALVATERALSRIIEGARQRGDQQIRSSQETVEHLGQEISDLTAWRDRIQPIVASIQGSLHEATIRVIQVGDRIQHALGPVTEAMDALASSLSELRAVAHEPTSAGMRQTSDSPRSAGHDSSTVNVPELETMAAEKRRGDSTGGPESSPHQPGRDEGGTAGSSRTWADRSLGH